MAVLPGFEDQYSSLDKVMRDKFSADFPSLHISTFDRQVYADRVASDSKYNLTTRTYHERRFFAECMTWKKFCESHLFLSL
jgi:hypothetical protein